jgi:hypothetical protein
MPKSPDELRREAEEIERTGKGAEEGKNPARVAGAKKAAATRKERYGSARPGTAQRGKGDEDE